MLCYDFFRSYWSGVKEESVIYDVKTLYELAGYDTEKGLGPLAQEVLGRAKTSDYQVYCNLVNIHLKTYKIAKINYTTNVAKKLLPTDLYRKFVTERQNIISQLYEKSTEHEFYSNFFYPVLKTLFEISEQPVYINDEAIKEDNTHFSEMLRGRPRGELFLDFNPIGAKTGRLSFRRGTPNFYILPKNLRKALIAPPDHSIVQIDFKSFQPRLAIFCTDNEEFKRKFSDIEDIYAVFPGNREENKIDLISWMFSRRKHQLFDVEAAPILTLRKKLHSNLKLGDKLTNKFGRNLHFDREEENVVLQNYVTSNEVDAILELMVLIHKFLTGKKSRIVFPFHDSIVFYIHKSEMNLVGEIKDMMEMHHKPLLGSKLPVSVQEGLNFGEMENWRGEINV